MIVSLGNLHAGLNWWRGNSKWGEDILNAEYYEVYGDRIAGTTEKWWIATVERLGKWRAYRGPKPPNTKASITERGAPALADIAAHYGKLIAASPAEPSIADLTWEDVAPLYSIAFYIKPSPVFAGKLCHFMFPKAFIVMDNWATGVFDYEFCWRGMKDEWCRSSHKAEATALLTGAIRSNRPLHPLYPLETKIMELSHIGYEHGKASQA